MERPPTSSPSAIIFFSPCWRLRSWRGIAIFLARFLPLRRPSRASGPGGKRRKGRKGGEAKQPEKLRGRKRAANKEGGRPRGQAEPKAPQPKEKPPAKPAGPEAKMPLAWVAHRLGGRSKSVPHVGHLLQSRRGPGSDRVEQPPLPRPRRPQRLSRPRRHGRGPPRRRRPGPGRRPGNAGGQGGLDEPDDRITAVADLPVKTGADLQKALRQDKAESQSVELTVVRAGKELKLAAVLGWRPLEVVRPERRNPSRLDCGRAGARRLESGKGLSPVDARHARAIRRPAP